MTRRWIFRIPMFIAFAVVFLALFGYVVMSLWNWLMPALFGLHHITYWQAVGILFLAKILFGGFRGGRHAPRHWRWRGRMMERWAQMTPEEREKFREEMRTRCGPFASMSGSKSDVSPS
jgi:hypothetical protein